MPLIPNPETTPQVTDGLSKHAIAVMSGLAFETDQRPPGEFTIPSEWNEVRNKTVDLFKFINLDVPELITGSVAGEAAHLEQLHEAQTVFTEAGLESTLTLSPVLPHSRWSDLFTALEADETINAGEHIKNGGVWFNDEITKNWDSLQAQQPSNIQVFSKNGVEWRLNINPIASAAPFTSTAHDGTIKDGDNTPPNPDLANLLEKLPTTQPEAIMHPTIDSYLGLQALRLAQGETPIDATTWTWLNGTFNEGSRAPSGGWGPDDGRVDVYSSGVGIRRGDLGVRPPGVGIILELLAS